jgi:hypothetical protein
MIKNSSLATLNLLALSALVRLATEVFKSFEIESFENAFFVAGHRCRTGCTVFAGQFSQNACLQVLLPSLMVQKKEVK